MDTTGPGAELPRLFDRDIVLRPLLQSDVEARQRLGKDPEVARNFGMPTKRTAWAPMTREEAEDWYHRARSAPDGVFAIELAGQFIGTTSLHDVNPIDRRARFGIGIFDSAARGRGVGPRATRLVLGYGFEQLELHRIDLRVLEFNERGIRCYQRAGFTIEGRERDSALIDGVWHSDIIMSMLEHEFTI